MAVPPDAPVNTPDEDPIVAIVVALLLHVPPPASLNVAVNPTQATGDAPVIAVGSGLIVTAVVTIQLEPAVNVIVAVPLLTPVTTPVVDPIVAILVLLLLQVPPPASLNGVVNPTQTEVVPVIADGTAFTTTNCVSLQAVLLIL